MAPKQDGVGLDRGTTEGLFGLILSLLTGLLEENLNTVRVM